MRTGGRLLVDSLLKQGADIAFCVPGESYLPVLDALYEVRERLRLIVCRQEGGAAYMGEAYGKLTGRPGIVFVTRGPGASNAAIGIHTAAQDSTPLIVFVGQVGSDFVDREAFQEIDYRRMFGGSVKWVAQIDRPERVPEYVARAFRVALSGRPGPVVLALPEDMLSASAEAGDVAPVVLPTLAAAPSAIDELRALLAAAQRPLVLVGGGGWSAGACRDLATFAQANALPVACAFRNQDLFDNRHPNYAGDVGIGVNPQLAARLRGADVLLVLGERLGEMVTGGYTLLEAPQPKTTLIHVHPGSDELGRVYQPALAIEAAMGPACAASGRHAAARSPGVEGERPGGTCRILGLAGAAADARRGRPVGGGGAVARRGCRRMQYSPTARATTPPGSTGCIATRAIAPSSPPTTAPWATACRRRSPPRPCIRIAWSCPGTATAAFS